RLEMVNLALEGSNNLRSSDFEFRLAQPSYTIDTLTHLQERYPEEKFVLIMGSDNLLSFKKWKNYEVILRDYQIYVYPRPGLRNEEFENHPSITLTKTPLMELSSTFIRKSINENKSVKYFLPDKV